MHKGNVALDFPDGEEYSAKIIAVVPYSAVRQKISVLEYRDVFDSDCKVVAVLYCVELRSDVYCDITEVLQEKFPNIKSLCNVNFLRRIKKSLERKKVFVSYSDNEIPSISTDLFYLL